MKIRNLFIAFFMLITLTTYTSCGKGNNKTNNAEVQLVSVNGSRSVVKKEKKEVKRILKANEEESEEETITEEEEEYSIDTLGNNVLIIPTSVMQYDITINLNNPYDHSIQDFRVQTTDTTLKMYNANLDRWDIIDTTKSIKWLGADNQSFKFTLLSSSEESVTSIKITEILYLNRSAQKVENVNLSTGPDYVDVVKADMPSTEIVKVFYDEANYINIDYRINFGKGVNNVKIDGELAESGKTYRTKFGEDRKLTWEIPYKDSSINGTYEKGLFTSLIDVYGINTVNVFPNPSDMSILLITIRFNRLYSLYDESTDLRFNIRKNGEKESFEIVDILRSNGAINDVVFYQVQYRCSLNNQELNFSDVFSIYVLNGEEEILLV